MLPGRTLRRLAAMFLPQDMCERVIDSQLADFQYEWRTNPKSVRVFMRGYFAFWKVFAGCLVRGLETESGDRRALIRMCAISLIATTVITALLAGPGFQRVPLPVRA